MEKLEEIEFSREYPFRGRIFDIACSKVYLPDGRVADREVMCHSGGVCVLPVDKDGRAIMVRQYRFGAGEVILEAPAGKLERGEDPEEAARRELAEETGCSAQKLVYLGFCYPTPAISTERIHIYLATDLIGGTPHADDGEFLEISRIPLKELVDRVLSGQIADAKTQIAILKAHLMLT